MQVMVRPELKLCRLLDKTDFEELAAHSAAPPLHKGESEMAPNQISTMTGDWDFLKLSIDPAGMNTAMVAGRCLIFLFPPQHK